jgi:hypothetical protein
MLFENFHNLFSQQQSFYYVDLALTLLGVLVVLLTALLVLWAVWSSKRSDKELELFFRESFSARYRDHQRTEPRSINDDRNEADDA